MRGVIVRRVAIGLKLVGAHGAVAQQPPPAPAVELPDPHEPPAITAQKYVEDYSYLRDPENRTGEWWEGDKYIPLTSSGWAYLTLGDELRFRFELFENNAFGAAAKPDENYLRYRQLPYADLHRELRILAQLIIAYSSRSKDVRNPFTDQTGFDVLQALAEWRVSLGNAGELTLRGGRQVMVYGSGRLINAGPNIRTTFDGGVVQWDLEDWRVDAFLVRPVRPEIASFNDESDEARRLWSIYATHTLREDPRAGIDLYYIGYTNDRQAFNEIEGRTRRHTLGMRMFSYEDPWVVDLEAALQLGSFAGADIRAWAIAVQARHTFRALPLDPWIGARAAAISGDERAGDGTLGTFDAMFPEGGYYGESGVIGPGNLVNLQPALGLEHASGFYATASLTGFWRQRRGDGIYGISGSLLRPDSGSRARYIGTQPEASVGWNVGRTFGVYVVYSLIDPGPFIEESGPAEQVHFVAAHAQHRF